MKNLKSLFVLSLIATFFVAGTLFAESIKETKIKTNAHCGNCKTKIEEGLGKADGIKSVKLNLNDKVAVVSYDADKTNEKNIRKTITDMGYNADMIKAKNPHGSPANKCDDKKCKDKANCGVKNK
jgi:mercuric ion binding protein